MVNGRVNVLPKKYITSKDPFLNTRCFEKFRWLLQRTSDDVLSEMLKDFKFADHIFGELSFDRVLSLQDVMSADNFKLVLGHNNYRIVSKALFYNNYEINVPKVIKAIGNDNFKKAICRRTNSKLLVTFEFIIKEDDEKLFDYLVEHHGVIEYVESWYHQIEDCYKSETWVKYNNKILNHTDHPTFKCYLNMVREGLDNKEYRHMAKYALDQCTKDQKKSIAEQLPQYELFFIGAGILSHE